MCPTSRRFPVHRSLRQLATPLRMGAGDGLPSSRTSSEDWACRWMRCHCSPAGRQSTGEKHHAAQAMGLLDSEAGKRRLLSVEIPVMERYNAGRDPEFKIRLVRQGGNLLLCYRLMPSHNVY